MISVIICGAGKGARAGFSENKLFYPLDGKTVIERTVEAFSLPFIDEIIVTSSQADEERMRALLPQANVVLGGESRTQSVRNALREVKGDIVLIHDGARPFVSEKVISDCIESVKKYDSGICALPATDTTVLAANGCIRAVPDRSEVYTVQTPQGFRTAAIRRAYELAGDEVFTDDSSVYSRYIAPAALFVGDKQNRKLTFHEDFMQETYRSGIGIDTHAFGKEQDFIVMGGIKIPSFSGLIAHSDGDVLLHAVMDALLSAAGLPDIGHYFPDSDPAYRGADSAKLLEEVVARIRAEDCTIVNLSIAVQAQAPKLAPYIGRMMEKIGGICALPPSRVGITAGTNEGLGYIGEKKGITVTAIALLKQTR
ncbi:MAG: 2-C-methyl-D-erythritol 4-phosphate cytidylyltransferase [Clostridia bacterium]|nr:2-C-methyl-D-erythritol 4-phosphate cytidylyltransferase [Clostridia bacterium]